MHSSPIMSVPPELISEFLVYTRSSVIVAGDNTPKPGSVIAHRYAAHRKFIATLSLVCRRFYHATIETPQLWTEINIPEGRLTHCFKSHIRKQISLSGSLPLSIGYVTTSHSIDFFSQVIAPHLPRCHVLYFSAEAISPGFEISRLLQECLAYPFPNVGSLTFVGTKMLSMYDAMGLFPPLNTPTLKTLRTQGFLPRFADQPLTSLELRPLQLPINELLEYITQFAETLRTIHIEEIGYAVAKGIFKAAIISDMKVLEKCWFKTGPGTLYSLLSNIRSRNLHRLDVNLLESYGETSSLETPWHLHSPSQVSWTLNDKNSVDSLSTLLHCSPRISKLELEIPSYLSRSSVFEVSQHLVNMFLGNPPDGEDNNWSSGIRRHSYVNLEELRCEGVLPDHIEQFVHVLSPAIQKLSIICPGTLRPENMEECLRWKDALQRMEKVVKVNIVDRDIDLVLKWNHI